MEKYGDLITNGLDLISFLLVTPEIVRAIAPTAGRLIGVVTAIAVSTLVWGLPVVLLTRVIHWRGGQFSDWFDSLVASYWGRRAVLLVFAAPFLAAVSLTGFLELTDDLARWLGLRATKHLLWLGVALFFISRLIAFYGSAAKAGFL